MGHQACVKLAASEQQGFIAGPGGQELGKWTRRWLTDTLDGKDVKSLHLITHCFAFHFGFGLGVASRGLSRGRAGPGTTGQAWPGGGGGWVVGVEAEICVKDRDSGLAVSVSTAMVCCVRAQSVACGAQRV